MQFTALQKKHILSIDTKTIYRLLQLEDILQSYYESGFELKDFFNFHDKLPQEYRYIFEKYWQDYKINGLPRKIRVKPMVNKLIEKEFVEKSPMTVNNKHEIKQDIIKQSFLGT